MKHKIYLNKPSFQNKDINSFIDKNIEIALSLNEGEYREQVLNDDLFIVAQNNILKNQKDGIFESHKKYIDIHYVIKGSEKIELVYIDSTSIPYEANNNLDYYLYEVDNVDAEIILKENHFAVFPFDKVHKVGIKTDEQMKNVIKLVIKIKESLFESDFIR